MKAIHRCGVKHTHTYTHKHDGTEISQDLLQYIICISEASVQAGFILHWPEPIAACGIKTFNSLEMFGSNS